MKHFDLDTARRVLAHWEGDPATLEHVATSGNAVYRFRSAAGPRILRLTDCDYRSPDHNRAEMSFLEHLNACGVQACAPVLSRSGRILEEFGDGTAVVLTWAPGHPVTPGSPDWNEEFFVAWGETLAAIHRAASTYAGPPRWDWDEEILIRDAEDLFDADDAAVHEAFREVVSVMRSLPQGDRNFGMTHGDFGPQNFHYDAAHGLTAFDFGNGCRHWYVSDIAISLSTLRREPRRDDHRRWILRGYRSVLPIDPEIWNHLDDFFRLRLFYVYLSRLRKFGPRPTPEEAATLAVLRGAALDPCSWPEMENA